MRKKRVVSSLLAIGLVASLFVSALSVTAHHVSDDDAFFDGDAFLNPWDAASAHSYFPWVPNDHEVEDMGAYTGSVTIQNLEPAVDFGDIDGTVEVDFLVGDSDGGWSKTETVELAPKESITLSADELGVPEGGASVVALGYLDRGVVCGDFDDPDDLEDELGIDVEETDCEWNEDEEEWEDPDQTIEGGIYGWIAGVVKNVSPSGGSASTDAEDTSVDGYSGFTADLVNQALIEILVEDEVGQDIDFDGTYVLPIVQTNDGWNTELHVANMSVEGGLSNVSVTLYGSGTQGYAGESQVINRQLAAGQVDSIDLSEYVEEGWVGSAYITSSADIAAVAERYKANENEQMLITNVSQPELPSDVVDEEDDWEYSVFGALVFKEYNYWNTGISVANTDPANHNNVTITYLGPTGNQVGQDTLTIPPRGQEYVYTPGTQDLGLEDGFVGSVRIEGTSPLHATIDQVKYFGEGGDVGHAMSYSPLVWWASTAWLPGDTLSMPLVQKGNPDTGGGDTSGIQLYNTSQDVSATAEITFYGANGVPVAPTVENNDADPIEITLGANQSYTLYTHDQGELSSGFEGSVVVERTNEDWSDTGGLVGVSNNVNYDVDGDGSVAFPMVLSFEEGF